MTLGEVVLFASRTDDPTARLLSHMRAGKRLVSVDGVTALVSGTEGTIDRILNLVDLKVLETLISTGFMLRRPKQGYAHIEYELLS